MDNLISAAQTSSSQIGSSQKDQKNREALGNTLLIGAGPAAVQMAVIFARGWTQRLGIASRCSDHWSDFLQQYKQLNQVSVRSTKPALSSLAGTAHFDQCYEQLTHIDNQWDTIVLCVPADCYQHVLKQIPLQQLDKIKRVILLSPSFGSHLIVKHQFQCTNRNIEVLSFSTYFAATKSTVFNDKNTVLKDVSDKWISSRINVITKARKKRIYISASNLVDQKRSSHVMGVLVDMLNSVDIDVITMADCFSVEARSITAYVHPPLFVNPFSLEQILKKTGPPKYMYKLFPEGPITPTAMKEMVQLWKEISKIVIRLNAEPINLLKFLNDDNYPVLEESIGRFDIENFEKYPTNKQEYLLYVRYASILVDPFSEPDDAGRYFDFSAVAFPKASYHGDVFTLPRVPLEDMKAMYVFYFLAKALQISVMAISEFIFRFETWFETNFRLEKNNLNNKLINNLRQSSQHVVDIILNSLDYNISMTNRNLRNHNE
ncbi:opine metallophore biosynthesis dehydrogenase [Marinomonas sp. RSW2]|uniref:Opine metallophore biosynthesis dehydrogenase n=1 Tax=Marinomonas maritima TaxID=2940935 RepID=A0ABT5WM84_9GAMM|nr:opine metallophore biosynthesis dehydrogenase [Marinomonas maritima]MDE8604801.1 opine metallophore biosynthesis dehydrogenase [Marinomonas maritima]